MARIQVQIYEIQNSREAEAVIRLGVDRIGSVILSEENWKVPDVREAILTSKGADVIHSLIPLFDSKEVLLESIDYYQPDIVHFCECLTNDSKRLTTGEGLIKLQVFVKDRFPEIEIMRTIPVGTPGCAQKIPTLEIAEYFEGASDSFLMDTSLGTEPVEGFIGITGRTGDWTVARQLVEASALPVILAGGLSPENVYEAVMAVTPFGVDSCTRTNALDGSGRPVRFKKDLKRVKAFVQEVRRAEQDLSSQ